MSGRDGDVRIRNAAPEDAPALVALRLAWERSRSAPTDEEAAYVAVMTTWIAEHRERVIGKLAELDGRIVGMAWLAVVDRVPVPTDFDRRSGEVQSVFVDASLRGRGIGRALMDAIAAEARARGIHRIVLHSTHEGVAFYRRIGWVNAETLLEVEL
jgi:GNAT superfamily N-acetyltransferase